MAWKRHSLGESRMLVPKELMMLIDPFFMATTPPPKSRTSKNTSNNEQQKRQSATFSLSLSLLLLHYHLLFLLLHLLRLLPLPLLQRLLPALLEGQACSGNAVGPKLRQVTSKFSQLRFAFNDSSLLGSDCCFDLLLPI